MPKKSTKKKTTTKKVEVVNEPVQEIVKEENKLKEHEYIYSEGCRFCNYTYKELRNSFHKTANIIEGDKKMIKFPNEISPGWDTKVWKRELCPKCFMMNFTEVEDNRKN